MNDVFWEPWANPGHQHLRLAVRESGVVADGVALGVKDGVPFRLSYEVRCDAYWRVRYVRVGQPGEPAKLELLSDGEGGWSSIDGRAVAYLNGCEYVDISDTPFTNTLPVRRLGLLRGAAADINVVYVDGMDLQPWPEPQRYQRLDRDGGDAYRFTSLDGGFTADLPVDEEGLVLDYPGRFRRTWPRPS